MTLRTCSETLFKLTKWTQRELQTYIRFVFLAKKNLKVVQFFHLGDKQVGLCRVVLGPWELSRNVRLWALSITNRCDIRVTGIGGLCAGTTLHLGGISWGAFNLCWGPQQINKGIGKTVELDQVRYSHVSPDFKQSVSIIHPKSYVSSSFWILRINPQHPTSESAIIRLGSWE